MAKKKTIPKKSAKKATKKKVAKKASPKKVTARIAGKTKAKSTKNISKKATTKATKKVTTKTSESKSTKKTGIRTGARNKTKSKSQVLNPEIVGASKTTALAPSDPVTAYMTEVKRYPLLSREEEKDVAIKYFETGDPDLAEVLVTSNLRFVVKVAAEYSRFGARLIDLIQEGNVGLMHAVKEFNPYKGVRLISYAVWWIRGYIQEHLMRQYSMVRIGTTQNQRKLFYQLQKQRDELERMGFEAGVKQLSGRLGISEKEIVDMSRRLSGRDVSLDVTVNEDGTSTLLDLQQDSDYTNVDDQLGQMEMISQLRDNIEEIRPQLNEREIFLLDNRVLSDEPMTLQEVGNKYGVTREAVRQLEVRLLKKIKSQMLDQTPV